VTSQAPQLTCWDQCRAGQRRAETSHVEVIILTLATDTNDPKLDAVYSPLHVDNIAVDTHNPLGSERTALTPGASIVHRAK
jgi:hypothetical protein